MKVFLVIMMLLCLNATGQKVVELTQNNIDAFVDAHNVWRKEVQAAPIKWNNAIQKKAEDYAKRLATIGRMEHSNGNYGENLYWFSGQTFSPSDATDSWGSEKSLYRPGTKISNTNYQDFGHYTQMIWHNTTEVGCGVAQSSHGTYVVCQYNPPGNFIGEKP